MQWPAYASIVAKFQERLDKLSNKINRRVFHSGQQVLTATEVCVVKTNNSLQLDQLRLQL